VTSNAMHVTRHCRWGGTTTVHSHGLPVAQLGTEETILVSGKRASVTGQSTSFHSV